MSPAADYYLDITNDVCPITFVKTKLQLEKMQAGQRLCVRLSGDEPKRNVPASVQELGHHVLELCPENQDDTAGIFLLLIEHQ